MRLVNAIKDPKAQLDLSHIQTVIIDEADRLFDLGFAEQVLCLLIRAQLTDCAQVDEVLAACTHPKRAVSLFSATMFQGVESFARTFLKNPIRITIGAK